MNNLEEIKSNAILSIPNGLNITFLYLKNIFGKYATLQDKIIALEVRYKTNLEKSLKGIITYQDEQLELNRIVDSTIQFIRSIEEIHLKGPSHLMETKTFLNEGKFLYSIPNTMQINREDKCLARVAFDKKTLIEDLDLHHPIEFRDIMISDIMIVDLYGQDPNRKVFDIRTISENTQFVDKNFPTEWRFYVTPRQIGTFSLILEVKVIVVLENKDRIKKKTLEEIIIVKSIAPKQEELLLKETGLFFFTAGSFDKDSLNN